LVDRRQLLWTTLCRFRNSGRWNPFLWYLIYASNFRSFFFAKSYQGAEKSSYLGGLGALDPQYAEYPPGISAADKARYFEPIRLTDEHRELTEWLAPYAGKIEGRVRDAAAEATERRLTSIGDAD
jgi:hypothetical protein